MKRRDILFLAMLLGLLASVIRAETITPTGSSYTLQARTYEVGSSPVTIPAGCTLTLPAGCVIHGQTGDGVLVRFGGSNAAIQGAGAVDGGTVYADGGKTNIGVYGIEIRNAGPNAAGLPQDCGLGFVQCNGVTVKGVVVHDCKSAVILDCSNVVFDSDEFRNGGYGVKFDGTGTNWTVRKCYFHDFPATRLLEMQGNCTGAIIEDNFFEKVNYGSTVPTNIAALIASLPLDASKNITVQRNTILGHHYTEAGQGGPRMMLELGGDNNVTSQNALIGGNAAMAITDEKGTCSVTLDTNYCRDVVNVWTANLAMDKPTLVGVNGSTAQLGWNPNRGRPTRAGTFDGSFVDAAFPPLNQPPPVVTPPPPATQPLITGSGTFDFTIDPNSHRTSGNLRGAW